MGFRRDFGVVFAPPKMRHYFLKYFFVWVGSDRDCVGEAVVKSVGMSFGLVVRDKMQWIEKETGVDLKTEEDVRFIQCEQKN